MGVPIYRPDRLVESFDSENPGLSCAVFHCYGCNLNCYGCHNKEFLRLTSTSSLYSSDELQALFRQISSSCMIDVVAFSGGELLSFDPDYVMEFLSFARHALGTHKMIRIDTNGTFPEHLSSVIRSGLVDGVVMDLKCDLSLSRPHPVTFYETLFGIFSRSGVAAALSCMEHSASFIYSALGYGYLKPECTFFRTVNYPLFTPEDLQDVKSYVSLKFPLIRHFVNEFVIPRSLVNVA